MVDFNQNGVIMMLALYANTGSLASFINFMRNDDSCKTLFRMSFKMELYHIQNEYYFNKRAHC